MIKIIFKNIVTNEIEERIYNTSKEKAIELYARSAASGIYKIIEIIDLLEKEEQDLYKKQVAERVLNTLKEVEKTIKKLIKNPYNKYDKIKYCEIKFNRSDLKKLKESFNDKYIIIDIDYYKHNNIELYFKFDTIQVNPAIDKFL